MSTKLLKSLLNEELTPDIEVMLQKIRKKSFGFLNQKKLKMVLEVLGWKLEPAVILSHPRFVSSSNTVTSGFFNDDALVRAMAPVDGVNISNNQYYVLAHSTDSDKKPIEEWQKTLKKLEAPLPKDPKNKHFYITNVTDVHQHKEYPETNQVLFDMYYAGKGFLVTTKGGKTYEWGAYQPGGKPDINEFVRWAMKNGILEDTNEVLGTEDYESERKNKKKRTEENVGTCGACFGQFKYKGANKNLVMHGFSRPGHGYLEGKCFGVNYQPYEISVDCTTDFVENLEDIKERTEKELQAWKDGKFKLIKVRDTRARIGKRETIDITPEDDRWESALKDVIREIESKIKYIGKDIETYSKLRDDWELKELS